MRRAFLAAALLALGAEPAGAQGHLVVVSGVGGEPRFSAEFRRQARGIVDAARAGGLDAARIHWLSEQPDADPGVARGRSTRENVEQALAAVARGARPGEQVTVVLVGHGSMQGAESRFNLPGPDLGPADFARMLGTLGGRPIVFVSLSSASGEFVAPLAGRDRVIITATKSGFERNEVLFGRYFVQALAGGGADGDKDGRVSLLEAFRFARRETARDYEQGRRLQTEHALLDDDGDGRGSESPGEAGSGDGALAAAMALVPRAALASRGGAADSLVRRKESLERDIARLRAGRDSLPAAVYEDRLEALVLELAAVNRRIRELEGGP